MVICQLLHPYLSDRTFDDGLCRLEELEWQNFTCEANNQTVALPVFTVRYIINGTFQTQSAVGLMFDDRGFDEAGGESTEIKVQLFW